jgi:2,5-diketo-D-gluconate reductase A
VTAVPTVLLNNGVEIPQLGFGVFKVPPEQTEDVTRTALEIGYRHVDTAQMYGNEAGVGRAVRAAGLARDEVFVTSKLDNPNHARDDALRSFDGTLAELGFDHVDLFLIHWPLPEVGDFVETWHAMEEIYRSARARAIGVSNFAPHHLRRLLAAAEVVPAVNQIEVHPYLVQADVRAFGAEHGIVTEAWAPIARGRVLDDPVITTIAKRLERTPAQVTLRWAIQRGDVVFPKSVSRGRIEENFDLFDFELADDEMAEITALDRQERTGPDPDTMNRV